MAFTFWPIRIIAFGFCKQGYNGFKVGILLFNGNNYTIVWTANCNDPLVSSNAGLVLAKNGELLLQTSPGQKEVIIADSNNGTVYFASMLDSGNFVLQNKNSNILWQSFDYPTDTMLGGQLLSSSLDTNQSSGRFELWMQGDGNLVLYPRYSDHTSLDAYWASGSDMDKSRWKDSARSSGTTIIALLSSVNKFFLLHIILSL
ncbi:EP1-like glycoprotein 2 isoform X2 [Prosopis cineraria]|uniref:EP1-like glycoprotein 2 isoform X2 n=1 Tax=Prosopis cineraria TaxID=364024 RepID=UPI00240FB01F|nr:EP1-like glycoprotein 2 isoform X2 [Prosopis cineraria]